MKVKELIELLQRFDGDATVMIDPYDDIIIKEDLNNILRDNPKDKLIFICAANDMLGTALALDYYELYY